MKFLVDNFKEGLWIMKVDNEFALQIFMESSLQARGPATEKAQRSKFEN